MKVYTTEEQELIMEPSLKWAGNPNILAVVKAYGLKASIQVCFIWQKKLSNLLYSPAYLIVPNLAISS